MKLTTTFWTDKVEEFDHLLFINGNTQEVVYEAKLEDLYQTQRFFRKVAQFVKTPLVRKSRDTLDWYQFAVWVDGELAYLKWFDLVVSDKLTLSHDIAFETTLVRKNGLIIPLGQIPRWVKAKKLPKYREFKVKAQAYRYLANQLKKHLYGR